MRVAYLDCFAGLAGDMFLGALLQAGVPLEVLQDATSALGIKASLRVQTVDRSGISAVKVDVLEDGALAEGTFETRHPAHTHAGPLEQQAHSKAALQKQPQTQHLHKTGHSHTNSHTHEPVMHEAEPAEPHTQAHHHGRSLTSIRTLIEAAELHPDIKAMAIEAFTLLGHSEAKIHNVSVEEIHFHEVGAVDAIVDIVATCAGIYHLGVGRWYSSPVNVGGGFVECAHGTFPVPAPATADLLRGMPTYSAHVQKELITPTGAALLRMLKPVFGQQPAMRVEHIGYGAGTRNPDGFPNVVRLSLGELAETGAGAWAPTLLATRDQGAVPALVPMQGVGSGISQEHDGKESDPGLPLEIVSLLETALDDTSPQLLAFVAEQALAAGAFDVMLTPVIMKKGRPGTLLTVLAPPERASHLQQLLLRETTTLGVRLRQEQRACLQRHHETVSTPFGPIRVKVAGDAQGERNAAPEFEDCKAAALQHNVPLKEVQQAALSARALARQGA